jgi:hypothetical protein
MKKGEMGLRNAGTNAEKLKVVEMGLQDYGTTDYGTRGQKLKC